MMAVRVSYFIIASVLQCQCWLMADDPPRQEIFTIGPETTRITKPLDDRGFVDYVAAVDEAARQGVTPENNYEVVVREVLGPIHEGEKQVEYFQKLGIKPPPVDGNYYESYPVFAEIEEFSDEHTRLIDGPWTNEAFPKAAEWVKLMDHHLDRLVEGTKRSEYYTPYTILVDAPEGEDVSPLMKVSLESAQDQREIAYGLKLRAMQRLGTGNLDGAWNDLQAIRRMSHHVAGGWTSIEALLGCALDSIAFDGEQWILQSASLTDDQTLRFLADLQKIPPLRPLDEIWEQGGRLLVLDALQWAIRGDNGKAEIEGLFKLQVDLDAVGISVDWDVAFKTINQFYDRLINASREENPNKQRQLFQDLDVELQRLKRKYESGEAKEELSQAKDKGLALGKATGEAYSYLLCPAFLQAQDAYDHAVVTLDLIRLGFAVEDFRRHRGRFPDTLNELTPEFVERIPVDVMSGDPLIYRPTDKGALIYSVGTNLHDDFGGDSPNRNREMDDIIVRVGKPVIPRDGSRDSERWSQWAAIFGVSIFIAIVAVVFFFFRKRVARKHASHNSPN